MQSHQEQQLIATVSSADPLHITTQDGRIFTAQHLENYRPTIGDTITAIYNDTHHTWIVLGKLANQSYLGPPTARLT